MGWLVGCRCKANCSLVGPEPIGEFPPWGRGSKGSESVFTRVSEKTTENSEQLGGQAQPGIESDTSRLPVLSATTLPLVWPEIMGQ